ncbi:hypothetical protein GGTG_05600 [Gaeumannomyces tritici R3-111a-1]|uniref:Aflatoxin biosynthesis ketoreductase nor-1 n=1 Tax=Gaeumannomyces tritici (strain R3-111a-1) TaxID=644352 RepID=J3NWD6_GAET3|nr:hypothetical protein GGTG_05600 [Gaeumannomyces tritici R3-111a-1]EJT75668.1 hypothetical protein GGTG_05600 [Gaeumannomyces tritici R3-111a-1]
MSANTVYVITGANKGIGRGIIAILLQRPATTVLALVRDPAAETSATLASLPAAPGSALHVLPLDAAIGSDGGGSSSATAYTPQLATLAAAAGVSRVDVVVANAGGSSGYKTVLDTEPADAAHDFAVNAVGPLRLFRAAWPLLMLSAAGGGGGGGDATAAAGAKFVYMTSSVGSIAGQREESFPSTAYGMSKAAANWLLVKIGVELGPSGLSVMALHPGWVKTSMGQGIADAIGFPEPPMTVEDSARACVEQIDRLGPETSGRFVSHDGKILPW